MSSWCWCADFISGCRGSNWIVEVCPRGAGVPILLADAVGLTDGLAMVSFENELARVGELSRFCNFSVPNVWRFPQNLRFLVYPERFLAISMKIFQQLTQNIKPNNKMADRKFLDVFGNAKRCKAKQMGLSINKDTREGRELWSSKDRKK